jgi:hypothetical protein
MPYPNEHAARVKSPGTCTDTVRRQTLGKGVARIACISKATGEWTTQAYRFKKDQWTASEARAWLREKKIKYTLFEPATGT